MAYSRGYRLREFRRRLEGIRAAGFTAQDFDPVDVIARLRSAAPVAKPPAEVNQPARADG